MRYNTVTMDFDVLIARTLSKSQIESLTHILAHEIMHSHYITVNLSEVPVFYHEVNEALKQGENVMAIAFDGDQVIGSVIAKLKKADFESHIVRISKLIIHEEYRRMGVASKLLEKIEDELKIMEKTKLQVSYVDGCPVGNLYENRGFTVWGVSRKAKMHKGKFYDEVYMEKFI